MIFINPDAKSNRNIPNISLAYAATIFSAKVIDQNTLADEQNRFLKYESDILGISVQTRTLKESERIKEEYLKKYPGAKVSSVSSDIDIQCCYPFLKWKNNIGFSGPFSDSYPFPNYELFDSFEMFRSKWRNGSWKYAIMTSLGCPYSCSYCMCKNRGWKARTPQNCFEEIKNAKEKWGIKKFQILDDCFNFNPQRVVEFCKLIKPLNLPWSCTNGVRADRLTEESAKAMADSGCEDVSFGIESTDPEVLKNIKKGENIEQIEKAIEIARKFFHKINGYFIIGLPCSSYEKDLASVKWAKKMGINAHFSYHVPSEDGVIAADTLFYGKNAHPMSNAYPKKLQEKIYNMTAQMRPQGGAASFAERVKLKLSRIAKNFFGSS